MQAAACFQDAAEGEPSNLKALGNWGNALLAHGQVDCKHLHARVMHEWTSCWPNLRTSSKSLCLRMFLRQSCLVF